MRIKAIFYTYKGFSILAGGDSAEPWSYCCNAIYRSIEASVFFFIAFERACKVQLLVDAASSGAGRPSIVISDEDAAAAYQTNGLTMLDGSKA